MTVALSPPDPLSSLRNSLGQCQTETRVCLLPENEIWFFFVAVFFVAVFFVPMEFWPEFSALFWPISAEFRS